MQSFSLGSLYPYRPCPGGKKSRAKKAAKSVQPDKSTESLETVELSGGGFLSKLSQKFGKVGIALCLMASISSAAQAAGGPQSLIAAEQFQDQAQVVQTIDNKAENAILKESGTCGEIIHLASGVEGKGAHLTIHGLGASPKAVKPLNDTALQEGQDTSTYVYKDMKGCDHRMNGEQLASEISEWASEHPDETLTIQTHSQGGRVALSAFRKLMMDDNMPENPIKFDMISPPLGGFSLANLVLTAPGPLARLIPGAAPTRDMASWSGASKQIRNTQLPAQVETKIYYGSADRMVNYEKGAHQKVAENLDAEVYYIADGVHTSTVPTVANPQEGDITSNPIPYKPANKVAGAFLW